MATEPTAPEEQLAWEAGQRTRARTMRAAVLGPTPGSASSSAEVAWLMSILRSEPLPTLPAGVSSPRTPTTVP